MEELKRIEKIIEELNQEVARIQILDRELTPEEIAYVEAINGAISYLSQALDAIKPKPPSTLITYKIASDLNGMLKRSARVACNFWNRFVIPDCSTVIRLGVFTEQSITIAVSYKPYKKDGVVYGRVEFNTIYLTDFAENEISGTIVHEIGHTLGFGWEEWMALFDDNGVFAAAAIKEVPDLENMRVETGGGPGTRYSHWDEGRHDEELMTGYKDYTEHVLPVTIDIMKLLGHQVARRLPQQTNLDDLLNQLAQVVFSRQAEAKAINLDHFEETDVWETIPHDRPPSKE